MTRAQELLNLVEGALRIMINALPGETITEAGPWTHGQSALGYVRELDNLLRRARIAPISGAEIGVAFELQRNLDEIWTASDSTLNEMAEFLNARGLVAARRGEEQAGAQSRVASSLSTPRGAKPADSSSTMPHRAGLVISIGAREIIRGEACGCWRTPEGQLFACCEAHA